MCPVCLPRLNPGAFLHAYIAFLHPASGLAVAMLSAAPDAFMPLSKGRAVLEAELNKRGVTSVHPLCTLSIGFLFFLVWTVQSL